MIPVFDGHNDFLLRLLDHPDQRDTLWLKDGREGHLDLPRMQRGGFAGGFFAIYIPSPIAHDAPDYMAAMENPPFALPLPDLIDHHTAQPIALAKAGHLLWMERASGGAFKVCRTVAELRECLAKGVISAILHMEGAEAIDPDLDALHSFHAMGLRSLGPVWSRPTVFGHGVPFAYPSGPDTGKGLTKAGKRLVRECNRLRIMLDMSHINEAGFWDVAALTDAPLVATHSNAHAVTPSSRNLTDRQLAAIRDSGGMVGLNYATSFLRRDGKQSAEMGWEDVLAHLDHLLQHLGEDGVGLGSDYDGATIPVGIGDVAGQQNLIEAMRRHGYGERLIAKIAHENWFRVLDRTWG
ncbi:dipeptidase [Tabrizicola oligotrophica]|uniref:Membrane dipeptidase n=1 Tax=Tabrizicola oligotrophica TaxID=2710650 RepID=A0A6M0QSL0_9RHOB|nr:dipeptidase [Tabrizicola oligotrophica]NEY90460.1 membrane dipeptidase [Tabrizicola oligotrophica]